MLRNIIITPLFPNSDSFKQSEVNRQINNRQQSERFCLHSSSYVQLPVTNQSNDLTNMSTRITLFSY